MVIEIVMTRTLRFLEEMGMIIRKQKMMRMKMVMLRKRILKRMVVIGRG